MSKLAQFKKPTYLFIFPNERSASKFLGVASRYSNLSSAVHPYDGKERCSLDKRRVLVIGCGSFVFDSVMRADLEAKAVKLGGYYMPKS